MNTESRSITVSGLTVEVVRKPIKNLLVRFDTHALELLASLGAFELHSKSHFGTVAHFVKSGDDYEVRCGEMLKHNPLG